MARTVSIGAQSFEELRMSDSFYVDKTAFIREWWRANDQVTLVCRPRRFGKTLMLDTVRCFLSQEFQGRGEELFGGLDVWADFDMRALQATSPVIALSFAKIKGTSFEESLVFMKRVIRSAVEAHAYLLDSPAISDNDRAFLGMVCDSMDNATAADALGQLCAMLRKHWNVKPVILLDEYDTPLHEAWLGGYWDSMSTFIRQLFNASFKTNPDLGRALVSGITRVASESIFSDMNNPRVVTTTTQQYETAFGFTEDEVAASLEEFDMVKRMEDVKRWYDGFTFGVAGGIYNPWSITHFLKDRRLSAYWANSSSNALMADLVRKAGTGFKQDFELLLSGGHIVKRVDERVDFNRLSSDATGVWSLMLATGYLRVAGHDSEWDHLTLALTNTEVVRCFDAIVTAWFADPNETLGEFVRSLLLADADAMRDYLSDIADAVMSSFDTGVRLSRNLPEKFWHGLVLGLVASLRGRYDVRSNPESGRGRSDVILYPLDGEDGSDPAFVLEFKVFDPKRERTLEDTLARAHRQIEDKRYVASLVSRGIGRPRIHAFGIVFRGKEHMSREFSYFYKGRARRLLVPVSVTHGSASMQVSALWDTGATQTCIALDVASSLGLKQLAKRKAITPVSGAVYLPLYSIDVNLPNNIAIPWRWMQRSGALPL